MNVALRELVRRPARFLPVGGALSLLVLLLAVLGGFLDGLTLNQTGSYRAQQDRLLVFSEHADLQLSRSRIPEDARTAVEQAEGVAAVGGLGRTATTATIPGQDTLQDLVVYGYEIGTDVLPDPPGRGEAVVDARLAELADVAVRDTLEVGPEASPLSVAALVDDVSEGSPTLWVSPQTWREITQAANPTGVPPEGQTAVLVVEPADGVALADLAERVEAVADVAAVEVETALDALPVVTQQARTFEGIIGVTFVVALLVVALFFALLTLERVRLYAVLKALGTRSRDLVAGLAMQAVAVAAGALVVGGGLAVAFVSLLPADLPVQLEASRGLQLAAGTLVTALAGALLTLRRVLRVDPARAIG